MTGFPSAIMSARQRATLAFASAIALLLLSGIAAYVTITHLLGSQQWVFHTLQVQAALGSVDSAIAKAGRLRASYLYATGRVTLPEFDEAAAEVSRRIQRVHELVQDNPNERELCDRLETATQRRLELFRDSIGLGTKAPDDDEAQGRITSQSGVFATEITKTIEQMRQQEEGLLRQRVHNTGRLFNLAMGILGSTMVLAVILFSIHYRLLSAELDARKAAEHAAHKSEESLRHLTVRLLTLQDEERRKISRELHDSLGQYLSAVKMNLDMYAQKQNSADELIQEALHLLEDSINETRMISHLLHPPLLDETGLGSAARWYIEGFARRSGVEVTADIPDNVGRLPESLELALFRVLQESLTNIHRHSKSSKAEVQMRILPDQAVLKIKDYGKGISRDLLVSFSADGTGAGVGLAGMRERIHELGGDFRIESSLSGTQIFVSMPLEEKMPQTKPQPSAEKFSARWWLRS
jgi:signal transduction histidine kinase